MDRQILLAVALSALVVIAYQEYLRIYYPDMGKQRTAAPTPPAMPPPQVAEPGLSSTLPLTPNGKAPAPLVGDIAVDTPLVHATISSVGGRLASFKLKRYRTTIDPQSPPLELVTAGATGDFPLGVVLRGATAWNDGNLTYRPSTSSLAVAENETAQVVLRGQLPEGGEIEKTLRFDSARYAFGVELKVSDPKDRFKEAALSWTHLHPENASGYYSFRGAEALVGGKLRTFSDSEIGQGVIVPDPRAATESPPPIHWAGYADSYFLSALIPREGDPTRLWVKLDQGEISTEILVPITAVSAQPYPFLVYAGPKDLHALSLVGHRLERSVDLGWFGFVAEPMLRLLKLFHRFSGNYGVDIILLTVLVKLVTVPLTQKSYKSMQELQKLQPQMKKLQEKYADDRATMNKEVMELYRRHKVNPLGGCLPMLLQMPIFIGLYNALLSAVELRHAPFAFWINDLSAPDRLPAIPHPPLFVVAGTEIRVPILTLLMGASMVIQQRMTPASADPMQQRMMMMMPVVFTVMFINFPSGLALYWLVNNVLTIAQQMLLQQRAK